MGVSAHDIFGDAAGAQPATPGSYGDAPSGYRLPAGTHLGRVRLQIADLARSLAYYEGTLGLRVLGRDGSRALLGAQQGDTLLVELHERPGVKSAPRIIWSASRCTSRIPTISASRSTPTARAARGDGSVAS